MIVAAMETIMSRDGEVFDSQINIIDVTKLSKKFQELVEYDLTVHKFSDIIISGSLIEEWDNCSFGAHVTTFPVSVDGILVVTWNLDNDDILL